SRLHLRVLLRRLRQGAPRQRLALLLEPSRDRRVRRRRARLRRGRRARRPRAASAGDRRLAAGRLARRRRQLRAPLHPQRAPRPVAPRQLRADRRTRRLRPLGPSGDAVTDGREMRRGGFVTGLVLVLGLAALLRSIYPAADPPWRTTVGIVWHDEGPWV